MKRRNNVPETQKCPTWVRYLAFVWILGSDGCSHASALGRDEVAEVLTANRHRLAACYRGRVEEVVVRFDVDASGSVIVRDIEPHPDVPLTECVKAAFGSLRFPRNDGRTPTITYPIRYK